MTAESWWCSDLFGLGYAGVMMLKRVSLLLVCALFLTAASSAQEGQKEKKILKNADILMMVQNHFDDDTLVKVIEVSDTDFDISGDALIALKNQGVSSAVLRAMLQATQHKRLAAAAAAAPASPAPVAGSSASAAAPAPAAGSPTGQLNGSVDSPAAPSNASGSAAAAPVNPADPAQNSVAPAPVNASAPIRQMPANPMAAMQGMQGMQAMQGMGMNPSDLANMQSIFASMGMGGMLGGSSFSMNNYTPEQMPHVFLMAEHSRAKLEVMPSTAEMAQTKYKSGMPGPGATMLRQLANTGMQFAMMSGGPSSMMAMSAFSAASGFMPGLRPGAPSMTYVWGLPGRNSSRILNDPGPRLELTYGNIPGVDPDAFEPVLLHLVQSKDNYRLVGATRVKMNMRNMMAGANPEDGKWMSEDRWPTRVYKEERGFYVLRVDQPLEPGEYAVVLRPVKGYKATPSGLGGHAQVFYSVWDFSVPGAPPVEPTGKKKK